MKLPSCWRWRTVYGWGQANDDSEYFKIFQIPINQMSRTGPVKKIFPTLFILLLLGLVACVIIIRIHHQIGIHPEEKSFWNISDLFNCNAVLASRYAKVGPFFIAELAIGYYLILLTGLFDVWSSQKSLSILIFLLVLTTISVVYSTILNIFSFVDLGAICLLCLLTVPINLAILILLFLAMEIPLGKLPRTIKRKFLFKPKSVLIYGSIALIVMGLGVAGGRKLNPGARFSFDVSKEAYLKNFFALPREEVFLPERPSLGNPDAQVTIVAFSDLQCRACRGAESVLKPLLKEYENRIRLTYLNFPLNPQCNPMARRSKHHLMGCLAAKEMLCAFQHGKFMEYYALVGNLESGTASPFDMAAGLGIGGTSFENCIDSARTVALLMQDIETGTRFKVKRLPSIYINGRHFRDWRKRERFGWVLESVLSQGDKIKK